MRNEHIIDMLNRGPLATLAENDVAQIRAHVEHCIACHDAYQAAQLTEVLVKERAAETIEPSPFFQTRVLAAWRERQESNAVPALWRLWRSAGALVSSMALTTAAIAVLSFAIPEPATQSSEAATGLIPNSAEAVVLNTEEYDAQMTDEEVLSEIYGADEEAR